MLLFGVGNLPYHPIMFPAFPRDPVIIIRNQIIQRPCFEDHKTWTVQIEEYVKLMVKD